MSNTLAHGYRPAVVSGALWLTLAGVSAQETSELPRTVVTPARTTQSVVDALPATSVITRGDIDRWQSEDLVSILSRETGVQFALPGGRGAAASLFLRGASTSQVLVLVDGVRLNAGASGGAALGGIALDAIERIEIVRGNLSSVYGSSAIGGVVQIFTRSGARPGLTFSAEAGQGRTLDGHASGGYDAGPVRLGGALGGGTTQAFSAINVDRVVPSLFAPGANPDLDGNQYLSASLGATYRRGEALVSANAWLNRSTTDFDSTADGPVATHVEKSQLGAVNVLARAPVTDTWTSQLAIGASRDRSTNTASDPLSFNNGEITSDNAAVTWTNELHWTDSITTQVGAEYLRQNGESTSYDASFSGGMQSSCARGRQRLGRRQRQPRATPATGQRALRPVLGYRERDQRSRSPTATGSIRRGGSRRNCRMRSGRRASTICTSHFSATPTSSRSAPSAANSALQYVGSAVSLRAALYRTDTRDLIAYDPATMRAQNIDEARVTGLNSAATGAAAPGALGANGTVLRAVDEQTGERLLRRAPWLVNLAAGLRPGAVERRSRGRGGGTAR